MLAIITELAEEIVVTKTETSLLGKHNAYCSWVRGMALKGGASLIGNDIMDEAILRGFCKQLEASLVWFVPVTLLQVSCCTFLVCYNHLINGMLWCFWYTPEG